MKNLIYVVMTTSEDTTPMIVTLNHYLDYEVISSSKITLWAIGTLDKCTDLTRSAVSRYPRTGAKFVDEDLMTNMLNDASVSGRFWTVKEDGYMIANLQDRGSVIYEGIDNLEKALSTLLYDTDVCSTITRIKDPKPGELPEYRMTLNKIDLGMLIDSLTRFVLRGKGDSEILREATVILRRLSLDHSSDSTLELDIKRARLETLSKILKEVGPEQLEDTIYLMLSDIDDLEQ